MKTKKTLLAAALASVLAPAVAEPANVFLEQKATVAGRYKFQAVKADGTTRELTDWFDNLILDAGLNRMGSGSYLSNCHVGTGNTAPTVTDTALAGFVANTTAVTNTTYSAAASAPYYGSILKTFRFGQGVAAGNLAEVGIGWGTGASLFSRALIKDGSGNPTTITVLSDEFLDVTYELRLYVPTADTVNVVNISGVNYTFTSRAISATSSSYWATGLGSTVSRGSSDTANINARNGALVAISVDNPSGNSSSATTSTTLAYSSNSYQRDFQGYWGLDAGNLAGSISLFDLATSVGRYQIGVSPVIPKDNTKLLNVFFRVSWGRYTG